MHDEVLPIDDVSADDIGLSQDAKESLVGFIDVSGDEKNSAERIMTVNGCLSTQSKWHDFDDEWQEYLKREHFEPDPKTDRYVFHTSPFRTGNLPHMPRALSRSARERIYYNLIGIICKYTVYRFGIAINLADFRQIVDEDFPYSQEEFFTGPGVLASLKCFEANSDWAYENGYSVCIEYVFDRGDTFFGRLNDLHRRSARSVDPERRTVSKLVEESKIDYSPIQAADIVAWECRNYFLGLAPEQIAGLKPSPRTGPELRRLQGLGPQQSNFRLYREQEFRDDLRGFYEEVLEKHGGDTDMVGDGKLFSDLDDFIKGYLAYSREEDAMKKLEQLKASRERKRSRESA